MERGTPDPEVQIIKAEILSEMGRFEEARAVYQKAAESFPKAEARIKATVQNGLGVCLHKLGKDDKALTHFQAASRIEPADASYQSNLRMAFEAVGQYSEALAPAQRAVELAPENHLNAMHLGILLEMEGRRTEAIKYFEIATELSREDADAHEILGQHLAKGGQHEKAVLSLQRAVDIEGNARRYDLLGASLGNLDRWPEAEAAFRRGLELEPNNSGILANLGATFANQGRIPEAIQFFERAVSANPGNAAAQRNLTRLREFVGRR